MSREPVHAVWVMDDEDNSIVKGVANYLGSPHYFEREYSDEKDQLLDTFALKRIDDETLGLVLEQARVLSAWRAVATGQPPRSPEQHAGYLRYRDLGKVIGNKVTAQPFIARSVHARFTAVHEHKKSLHPIDGEFLVEWGNAA